MIEELGIPDVMRELRALREDVAQLRAPTATDRILTRDEAMAFCKITNRGSWARFCAGYGLKSVKRNRYNIRAVERALDRQARGISKP